MALALSALHGMISSLSIRKFLLTTVYNCFKFSTGSVTVKESKINTKSTLEHMKIVYFMWLLASY